MSRWFSRSKGAAGAEAEAADEEDEVTKAAAVVVQDRATTTHRPDQGKPASTPGINAKSFECTTPHGAVFNVVLFQGELSGLPPSDVMFGHGLPGSELMVEMLELAGQGTKQLVEASWETNQGWPRVATFQNWRWRSLIAANCGQRVARSKHTIAERLSRTGGANRRAEAFQELQGYYNRIFGSPNSDASGIIAEHMRGSAEGAGDRDRTFAVLTGGVTDDEIEAESAVIIAGLLRGLTQRNSLSPFRRSRGDLAETELVANAARQARPPIPIQLVFAIDRAASWPKWLEMFATLDRRASLLAGFKSPHPFPGSMSETFAELDLQPAAEQPPPPAGGTHETKLQRGAMWPDGWPGTRSAGFTIPGLLSSKECAHYIAESERIGFEGIRWEYTKSYRDCDRITLRAEALATTLWRRLKPLMQRADIENVRPCGFGNGGVWIPEGINPVVRVSRYGPAGHFQAHRDGGFVDDDNHRSIYTVFVYLNGGFAGGETRFFAESSDGAVLAEHDVTPVAGFGIVFNHDTLHAGVPLAELPSGSGAGDPTKKYIMRTDIMFRRINQHMLPDPMAFVKNPEFIEAERLYQRSIQLQQDGDPTGSTESYLAALAIHAKLPSVDAPTSGRCACPENQAVGTDFLWTRVFGLLDPADLLRCMCVCRRFQPLAMASQVWYQAYRRRWPALADVQAQLNQWFHSTCADRETARACDLERNWMFAFRYRHAADTNFQALIVDLGFCNVRYGMLGRSINADPYSSNYDSYGYGWTSQNGGGRTCVAPDDDSHSARGTQKQKLEYDETGQFGCLPGKMVKVRGHYWGAQSGHKMYAVGKAAERFIKQNSRWGDADMSEYTSAARVVLDGHSPEEPLLNDTFITQVVNWLMSFGFDEQMVAAEHPVLLALPAWVRDKEIRLLLRVLATFEVMHYDTESWNGYQTSQLYKLQAPWICLKRSSELALIAASRDSGLVIQCGGRTTAIVPVWQGVELSAQATFFPVAGEDVANLPKSDQATAFFDKKHSLTDAVLAVLDGADPEKRLVFEGCILLSGDGSRVFEDRLRAELCERSPHFELKSAPQRGYDVVRGGKIFASCTGSRRHFLDQDEVKAILKGTLQSPFSLPGR